MANVLPGQYYDTIQCRLQEVSLKDNSARFLALSYCWNTSKTEETVTVDGQPVRITTNLHAALRNARAPSTAVSLWVDQICVDQTNIIDRNDQVGKMGAIFRAASGVIVWLGEADDGVASAMDLPKKIRRYWPSLYDNPSLLTHHSQTPAEVPKWGERAWRAFQALLLRPWFKRLWVIQEIACARDIVVTCRSNTALWKDFVKLIYVVDAMHHSSLGVNHMLGSKSAAQYVGFMEELRSVTEQGTKQAAKDYASEDSMAPYVLRMAKDCNATDHRDKLYAFHHIIRLVTRPDYAVDIETLYQQFAVSRVTYRGDCTTPERHSLTDSAASVIFSEIHKLTDIIFRYNTCSALPMLSLSLTVMRSRSRNDNWGSSTALVCVISTWSCLLGVQTGLYHGTRARSGWTPNAIKLVAARSKRSCLSPRAPYMRTQAFGFPWWQRYSIECLLLAR